jgi:hypothetical protein
MATDLEELRAELTKVTREVNRLSAKVRRLEKKKGDIPGLVKARGILKGADFTDEEIEAAKIRVKDIG